MELHNLKFVIEKSGKLTTAEEQTLINCYTELFKEIYGYDILNEYLKEKNKLKNSRLFKDTFIEAIDILKSVRENKNIELVIIYDADGQIIGFSRIKMLENKKSKQPIEYMLDKFLEKHLRFEPEKNVSIPDVAISSEYQKDKYEIWKKLVSFVETYVRNLGFDRLYLEIPINSPLLFKADDLGFIESPEDIPITEKPRTRILNKNLERTKDAEFNNSRK